MPLPPGRGADHDLTLPYFFPRVVDRARRWYSWDMSILDPNWDMAILHPKWPDDFVLPRSTPGWDPGKKRFRKESEEFARSQLDLDSSLRASSLWVGPVGIAVASGTTLVLKGMGSVGEVVSGGMLEMAP